MRSYSKVTSLSFFLGALLLLAPVTHAQYNQRNDRQPRQDLRGPAAQLFALANQARARAGVGRLKWDPDLAEAARQHCLLMAREGPIEHQYRGEPDLTQRAAAAGARFSLIEENIAIGSSPDEIQTEWMHSPPHRANMLNPEVDRIGTAVVESRGVLYAVADFSAEVRRLTTPEIEARVANMIRVSGVKILPNPLLARRACTTDQGMPPARPGRQPRFLMRWQASSLNVLPKALTQKLASGRYHSAAVGSCRPHGENGFTGYRVAVLLY